MALAQIYSAVAGHVITAARWNNEFGNIYTNGTDLAFPLTKAVSLAGWTMTLDAAGVTTITSTSSTGFNFTVGAKSGAPGANGSLGFFTASTFTDTSTAAAGTATLWTGLSVRTPTLAASNAITTTDAATVYIEGPPTAGANQTITRRHALLIGSGGTAQLGGDTTIAVEDSRTTTVDAPLTVRSTTSGTPAAGIGTGILLQAESQDEVPSDVGQVEFAFSDRTTASEDSYFQILLRVAGAALVACWRFVATTAFKGIFTHANTADRTYTWPDRSFTLGIGDVYSGPSSTGASSTQAHEGAVQISASQALDGIHYYTTFILDAGDTVTLDNGSGRLIIIASQSITINGIIDGIGAGSAGGAGGAISTAGTNGNNGYTQPAGGGGGDSDAGGDGGDTLVHGISRAAGGIGGGSPLGPGTGGTTQTGDAAIYDIFGMMGGASGGGGSGDNTSGTGGAGGRGGGSIVLIAPTIILGAASGLKASGAAGSNGTLNDAGGGGGGGSGNILMICNSYTDNGCTFAVAGGAGGTSPNGSSNGGAGAAGIRQINIHA